MDGSPKEKLVWYTTNGSNQRTGYVDRVTPAIKHKWERTYSMTYGVSGTSFSLDEQNLYYGTRSGILSAINKQTGKDVWRHYDFWVNGDISPSIDREKLYISSDNRMCAFNKQTGKLIWEFKVMGI